MFRLIYIILDHFSNKKIIRKSDGTIEYFYNNMRHRSPNILGESRPAVIYPNGGLVYYKDGQLHRHDGPAIVKSDCTIAYYVNDQLHRDPSIGPASIDIPNERTISKNFIKSYIFEGRYHRPPIKISDSEFSLPARIEYTDPEMTNHKIIFYFINDQLHRLDGPAYVDHRKLWHVKGKKYNHFDYHMIFRLQIFIRFLHKHCSIYSPSNLGGVYTKEELTKLIT